MFTRTVHSGHSSTLFGPELSMLEMKSATSTCLFSSTTTKKPPYNFMYRDANLKTIEMQEIANFTFSTDSATTTGIFCLYLGDAPGELAYMHLVHVLL